MESEYKSRMETSTEMLFGVIKNTITLWKEEIKTDGASFDFDSQDSYRAALEQIVVHNLHRFTEDINPLEKKLLSVFIWQIKEMLSLYEKNEEFFEKLDRKWLELRAFRKNFTPKEYNEIPDETLKMYITAYKENTEREEYFKTSFFENIGFLEINFHREIYHHSKILLDRISKGESETQSFNQSLLYRNKEPLFPMLLIGGIHPIVNDIIIEPISDLDLFKELNYMHTINKIKVKRGKNNCFYFLIHKLWETIQDSSEREKWLKNILKDLDIEEKVYASKYRYIVGNDAGKNSKKFAEDLNAFFSAKEIN